MATGETAYGEVNTYTLVHTGAGGDGKRWRCGPGGPAGTSFPSGEQGYTSGEYEVFENQTLRGGKALADARPWCVGFVFKHTDSFGIDPEFRLGTCYLVSRLVVGGTRVPNLDSYLKESTPCLQRIKDSFRRWDSAASGLITKEELVNVMTTVWPDATEKDLQKLMAFADKSADGKIRYAEFIDWLWGGSSEGLAPQTPAASSHATCHMPPSSPSGAWGELDAAIKEGRDRERLQCALEEAQAAAMQKFEEAKNVLADISALEAPLSRAEAAGDAAALKEELEVAEKAMVRPCRLAQAKRKLEMIEATLKPIHDRGDVHITGVQAAMEWASSELLRAQVNAKNRGEGIPDAEIFQRCRQALAFLRLKAVIGGADDVNAVCAAMRVCSAVGVPEQDLEEANVCVGVLRAVQSTDEQVEEACDRAALQDGDFNTATEWLLYVCQTAGGL
eukprot:TRINITY_DN25002_c0_g1_i1.p1 TRINITY_DN25002_c0_g1~~TRINITY_DN25002_c0_g1_i1.p1  ORF type:complete len:447 (-),score=105.01 TRINITY_DN25002_c0_g1_i1:341-1681(-)